MPAEPRSHDSYSEDARLVESCLGGDKAAWVALVNRYRRLIYSIPIRLGLKPEEADDVFQDVCLKLLSRLDTLKDGRSLTRWLVVTTQRRVWDRTSVERRYVAAGESPAAEEPSGEPTGQDLLLAAERDDLVRRGLGELKRECQELLEALFFEDPAPSYADLGRRLGRPQGSLGPVRLRCLKALRAELEKLGFA